MRRRTLLICLLVSVLIQFPLAWAIVYVHAPGVQGVTSMMLNRPTGSASNVDKIHIENNSYFCVRWVTITALQAPYTWPVYRSDFDPIFDERPTWPFPAEEVFPALIDEAKWPPSITVPANWANANYGMQIVAAYSVGWPYLCATGASTYDFETGRWSVRGAWILREPSFRGRSNVGCVPLCYTPRWQGVLLNAACFFPVVALVVMGPKELRAWRRRRRGFCRACGYDLSATPAGSPCPECGGSR